MGSPLWERCFLTPHWEGEGTHGTSGCAWTPAQARAPAVGWAGSLGGQGTAVILAWKGAATGRTVVQARASVLWPVYLASVLS